MLGHRTHGAQRAASLVLMITAALAGCGGGGGGGGTPTAPAPVPPAPAQGIAFTPTSQSSANTLSWRAQAGAPDDRLRLELFAQQVEGLYGLAFDLRFPSAVLRFEEATEGTGLSADGAIQTSFLLSQAEGDRLVVGLTRLGPEPGFGGSAVLLVIEFSAIASGSGALAFENPRALAPRGLTLGSVGWIGGRVVVG